MVWSGIDTKLSYHGILAKRGNAFKDMRGPAGRFSLLRSHAVTPAASPRAPRPSVANSKPRWSYNNNGRRTQARVDAGRHATIEADVASIGRRCRRDLPRVLRDLLRHSDREVEARRSPSPGM